MLLVSHEMNFIRHVSNRVIFLDKGHVVEDGTPKEVFEHPQNQRTQEFFSKMHIMAQLSMLFKLRTQPKSRRKDYDR